MDNNIWFIDLNNLFNKDNLLNIVPSSDMTHGEKINTITRFALYLSILLYLITGNYLYFYIFLITIVVTYLIYIFNRTEKFNDNDEYDSNDSNDINSANGDNDSNDINSANGDNESNTNKVIDCRKPTLNNPLMNPLIGDNPYKIKQACNIDNNNILENVDKRFCNKLYQTTSNIFSNRNNQRQFYSMPNTKNTPDKAAFANWLYKTPVSCAIGNNALLKQQRACSFNHKTLDENKKDFI